MEEKEYEIPTIAKGDIIEFLDADGNPFKPSSPVKYKILSKSGSIIDEGTISDSNRISIRGKKTHDLEVIVESCIIAEITDVSGSSEAPDSDPDSGQGTELTESSESPQVSSGQFNELGDVEELS